MGQHMESHSFSFIPVVRWLCMPGQASQEWDAAGSCWCKSEKGFQLLR